MIYRFGVFELDGDRLVLSRRGQSVAIEPQPARALVVLLERAGGVVTRDELRARIWDEGTHVDFDRGLAYCISQLRTALGDSADSPRFVETLPRRGFRFIAPVTPLPAEAPPPAPAMPVPTDEMRARRRPAAAVAALLIVVAVGLVWWAAGRSSRVVVAVSVFDNETGDPSYDAPLSTIADSIVERLTAMSDRVAVVGNMPSVRRPRDERDLVRIRTETQASFVLLGQLQRRDDRLSLFLQFIALDTGEHVWVDRIPRPDGDRLTGVAGEAAGLVAGAVRDKALGEATRPEPSR